MRGSPCRKKPEHNSDKRRKHERDGDNRAVHREGNAESLCRNPCEPKSNNDANAAAEQGQHYGLDKELRQHLPLQRTDRKPDAYFPCSLGYGHKHNVHDAYAPDEQADSGHRSQKAGQ